MFKINTMEFLDSINIGIDRSKLKAAKELSKRDRRYKDILSMVISYCEEVEFIKDKDKDKKERTHKFEWLCSVVDIHLSAIMLNDQIDGNDIPMDTEMIQEDNESKAKQIVESIALYLVAASPKLKCK
ncbi:hypothetical protein [Vibrio sp. 1S139]|uniref:hypothetical protein n=1 Tax=Vibrio sp. 1S139 TaxID=3230006 RepID=UPI00352E9C70